MIEYFPLADLCLIPSITHGPLRLQIVILVFRARSSPRYDQKEKIKEFG